jgi:hypothetical protein
VPRMHGWILKNLAPAVKAPKVTAPLAGKTSFRAARIGPIFSGKTFLPGKISDGLFRDYLPIAVFENERMVC